MEISIFEIFIRECGTVERAANILGTSHQNVSSMRNGRTWVKFIFAQKIEKYLLEKMQYQIDPLDLVSPIERNELKSLALPCTYPPIKSMNVSISHIKCDAPVPCAGSSNRDQLPLNQLRPIILNEHHQVIVNPRTYFLYQQHQKKTVPAWRISVAALLDKQYRVTVLVQTFLLSERVAIGIAAKKCLGNRQGQRSDLELRRKLDEVRGRTDELVASLLGFGCKDSYRQAEKIQLLGSHELIQAVNEEKLSIFKAAKLTRFSHAQQREMLAQNKKEIRTLICQCNQRT